MILQISEYNRKADSQIQENKLMVTNGEKEKEKGKRYKLLYVK